MIVNLVERPELKALIRVVSAKYNKPRALVPMRRRVCCMTARSLRHCALITFHVALNSVPCPGQHAVPTLQLRHQGW